MADLEKVDEFRRAGLSLDDAAARLGVSVADLVAFTALLEKGRAFGTVQAAGRALDLRQPPAAAEHVVSIRAAFPSMMRGR